MPEVTLSLWVWMLACIGFTVFGAFIGVSTTKDMRKYYENEYEQKHAELSKVIRKETKCEWSKGWDDAYRSYSDRFKKYVVYMREHDITDEQIEDFYEKYLNS